MKVKRRRKDEMRLDEMGWMSLSGILDSTNDPRTNEWNKGRG